MRALGTALRTPVSWQVRTGNRGDGDLFGSGVIVFGQVEQSLQVVRDARGRTKTRPMVVRLDHDSPVSVGDRVTVDDDTATVTGRTLHRGAFGVPHSVTVEAS